MRFVISMTAYRRPDYTGQVIAALAGCTGVGDWLLLPHVEPGHREVRSIFESIDFCECSPTFNPQRLGLNRNTQAALQHAAASSADFLVHLEDDTVPADDFLEYAAWACDEFSGDASVFTVAGYNNAMRVDAPDHHTIGRRDWFTCWGWGTWRPVLKEMLAKWSFKNPQSFAWHLNKQLRGDRQEIHPVLSRIQNIGYEQGENGRSAAWYRQHHRTPTFAGDFSFESAGWRLKDREVTA